MSIVAKMNPIIIDDTPTSQERREIDRIIERMQESMRDIPREGRVANYLDKQLFSISQCILTLYR